jgi:hypothetical protein
MADKMAKDSVAFIFAPLQLLLGIIQAIGTFGCARCANVYLLTEPDYLELQSLPHQHIRFQPRHCQAQKIQARSDIIPRESLNDKPAFTFEGGSSASHSQRMLASMCWVGTAVIRQVLPLSVQKQTSRLDGLISEFDAVDGSSTGTRVPWMWALLRLPRFGGANHADDHDNRSRYCQISFPGSRR